MRRDVARLLARGRRRRCGSACRRSAAPSRSTRRGRYCRRAGSGSTRSVGSAASLTRRKRRPSASLRELTTSHAALGRVPRHLAASAPSAGTNCVPLNDAVQDRHVEAVDEVLVVLQPVAGNDLRARRRRCCWSSASSDSPSPSCSSTSIARQHRLLLGRAEVGEDQAVALLDRIPGLAHVAARAGRPRARTAARGSGPRTSNSQP